MLRVTLELVPGGHENVKQVLGTVEIANITANPTPHSVFGDYSVAMRGQRHADATLRGVPRRRDWRMVLDVLAAVLDPEPQAPLSLQALRDRARGIVDDGSVRDRFEEAAEQAGAVLALLDIVARLPGCEGVAGRFVDATGGESRWEPGCIAPATLEYDALGERVLWCDAHGHPRHGFERHVTDLPYAPALRRLLGLPPGTRGL